MLIPNVTIFISLIQGNENIGLGRLFPINSFFLVLIEKFCHKVHFLSARYTSARDSFCVSDNVLEMEKQPTLFSVIEHGLSNSVVFPGQQNFFFVYYPHNNCYQSNREQGFEPSTICLCQHIFFPPYIVAYCMKNVIVKKRKQKAEFTNNRLPNR